MFYSENDNSYCCKTVAVVALHNFHDSQSLQFPKFPNCQNICSSLQHGYMTTTWNYHLTMILIKQKVLAFVTHNRKLSDVFFKVASVEKLH